MMKKNNPSTRLGTGKVIIVGAGEQGAVALNCLKYDKGLEFVGFLDDVVTAQKNKMVVGKLADHEKFKDCYFHIAIGKNAPRKKVFEMLSAGGHKFVTLIHPKAFIEPGVSIGENVFIGANAYINVGSRIGDNTMINNGCIVEHDNVIGDHCHLTPGVVTGGGVTIDDFVFIGLNSTLRDHIMVGQGSVVGMGTVVTKDVPPDVTTYSQLKKLVKHN